MVKSCMRRPIYGVGICDVDYIVQKVKIIKFEDGTSKQKLIWKCPFYQQWVNMLERVYSKKHKERFPTYNGVQMVSNWFRLTGYKDWAENQNWLGKSLDKDIIVPGNKIYGPDTCAFVNQLTNSFIVDSGAIRGAYPIGVSKHTLCNKFVSKCCDPFLKKNIHLGMFFTPEEAHEAWRAKKHELAQIMAETESDHRVIEALKKRYSYEEWYSRNPL